MIVNTDLIKSTKCCQHLRLICSYVLIIVLISIKDLRAESDEEILDDMPTKSDLTKYVGVLERINNFCKGHKDYGDVNMHMAMFITNVNLKPILRMKWKKLPQDFRLRVKKLIKFNEDLVESYRVAVVKSDPAFVKPDSKLKALAWNEDIWSKYLIKFNFDLLSRTMEWTYGELVKIFGNKKEHEHSVSVSDGSVPTLDKYRRCYTALEDMNRVVHKPQSLAICNIPDKCKDLILNDDDSGYGLSRRVFFLILARYARSCSLISVKDDKELVNRLCLEAYKESQYIVANNYSLVDLLAEHMGSCGLAGNAQFIRRTWIKNILDRQISPGCLVNKPTPLDDDADYDAEDCDAHLTAVATIVVSLASRYILETFY